MAEKKVKCKLMNVQELIKKYIQALKLPKAQTLVIYGGIAIIAISLGLYYFIPKEVKTQAKSTLDASESVNAGDGIVSVVGIDSNLAEKNSINNSWPAEIISNDISQIQPQREGVINDWRVHIGEQVREGQILGKISAPPATPELIQMLSERAEALAMAKGQITATDNYAQTEQKRLDSLKVALNNNSSTPDSVPIAAELERLRNNVEVKRNGLRAFIERALSSHVSVVANFKDWKFVNYNMTVNDSYGVLNQKLQYPYKVSLTTLVNKMKTGGDVPIDEAQTYFSLAVSLANNTIEDPMGFKAMAAADEKDFFDMLTEYKMAQSEVTDKEVEYKIMLNEQASMLEKDKSMLEEKISMLEKDKSMTRSNATAVEASYATVYSEIKGGTYIKAPQAGIISAIYKKVGDLVGPEMAIATITGGKNSSLIARIRIPNNIILPKTGDVLDAVRPGFPKDIREVKIIGIGSSLDDTGSYMADAQFTSNIDWPVEASIRVIPLAASNMPVIKFSSIVWADRGDPFVWAISSGGRIYAKHLKIGRILGASVEIYEGLKNGDKYLSSPTSDMKEDMLLEDIIKTQAAQNGGGNSSGKPNPNKSMPGMDM